MTEPVLQVRGLEVAFTGSGRAVPAVRGIDFDVGAHEVLGIVGESGSGKSVTSLALTGLLPRTAKVRGSVRFAGTEVIGAPPEVLRRLRGRDVGMIFQDPTTSLNPVLPIGRQVTEGQVAHGLLRRQDAPARAVELLAEVDIPDPAGRSLQYPHQFSGGMRQRAVIAMAMSGRPQLIIADEPTTALDVTVQAQVLALLQRRQVGSGAAVILITHDLGVIAEIAHRVLVMYGGRIVEAATVEEIFAQPRHPYTVGLLRSLPRLDRQAQRLVPIPGQPPSPTSMPAGCTFHPRCPIGEHRERCRNETPELRAIAGSGIAACHFAEEVDSLLEEPEAAVAAASMAVSSATRGEPLLVVDDLEVHFPLRGGLLRRQVGLVRAVDGVSLELRAGETLGLVGEFGLRQDDDRPRDHGPDRGDRRQHPLRRPGDHDPGGAELRRVRRHMQYVFQDPYASLNPIRTVEEIVAEPLRIHGVYEEMRGAARIAELFDLVGLSRGMLGRYPHEFSGGQRQRIGIARALALEPRLLILDEPVAALDVSIQAQIVNLLKDLQAELGLAYLFIAHDLSVVRHISDRVAVMYLGRIVEDGSQRRALRPAASTPTPSRCSPPCRCPTRRDRWPPHRARRRHPEPGRPAQRLRLPPALLPRDGTLPHARRRPLSATPASPPAPPATTPGRLRPDELPAEPSATVHPEPAL